MKQRTTHNGHGGVKRCGGHRPGGSCASGEREEDKRAAIERANDHTRATGCLVDRRDANTVDLSYNKLVTLPPAIASLTALEQLWLNDNPLLEELPSEIEFCKQLRVLDLRRTALSKLPREMGRLKKLIEIDLRETPFAAATGVGATDTDGLVESIARKDRRENHRLEMLEKVVNGVYREVADTREGQYLIPELVQAVCDEFTDLDELRNVVRNCDRLFPTELRQARNPRRAAKRLHDDFTALRRQNEKKKLSAELELKLRAIYYDVIEPESVEGIIKGIYQGDWAVEKELELEDIHFLIKNAPRLFPDDPETITGPGIRSAVWALQQSLTDDREEVIAKVKLAIMSNLYPDREPADVEAVARAVGKLFERDAFATKKELEEMKKLAADASLHFPAEFQLAQENPQAARMSFKRASAASAAMGM
eukprot:CAMPEP_0119464748 /NCGR_PEP_ID=MMETSP1344-20130328/204_1 /TAXON_ID=236787 /ORGANISM="Florenciella parvula, Strain CCMP2471" /LENGTH=423 /DNA_ID=CAMNT_0007496977 /DNA_START=52 /DNA_END=1324 /DNA_ORIENTATION=-